MSRYQNSGSQLAAETRRPRRGGGEGVPAWSAAWTAAATSCAVSATGTLGAGGSAASQGHLRAAEHGGLVGCVPVSPRVTRSSASAARNIINYALGGWGRTAWLCVILVAERVAPLAPMVVWLAVRR